MSISGKIVVSLLLFLTGNASAYQYTSNVHKKKPTPSVQKQKVLTPQVQRSQTEAKMPKNDSNYTELVAPTGFVNSEPITIGQFIGKKVIMVTFITFGCSNCRATFPWLKKMNDLYALRY